MQLLVPFLIEPRIMLFSLTELPDLADADASKRLKVKASAASGPPPTAATAFS